ncbi:MULTISPECIES: hypothetical protein [unclassified Aureimonas]|uniref:hypothetical protein n=1 Tax=unclassified Aureimonas TaxID=2615206 RepID=UPI0011DF7D1D|nr:MULTISPECIES: hypothetical protein [unclassified Aureimonas]
MIVLIAHVHQTSSEDEGERDEQDGFFSSLSALNTGPRATGVGVLRRRSASSRALDGRELAKDQLPETDPDNGGQAR